MSSSNDSLPTIGTYWTILTELFTAPDCDVWGMPVWLQNVVTVLASLFIILYIYVIAVIIKNLKKLDNPFYICTISMAACDFVILFMALRGFELIRN